MNSGSVTLCKRLGHGAVAAVAILLAGCGTTVEVARRRPPLGGRGNRDLPSFRVFRSQVTPNDELPTEVVASLAGSSHPIFERRGIHEARRVLPDRPGWLVPAANGEVCLVDYIYPTIPTLDGLVLLPAVTHSCASESEAQGGRLLESQSLTSGVSARTARVVGVVPNAVHSVTVIRRHGPPVAVDVMRNAYEVVVTEPVAVRVITRKAGKEYTRTVEVALVQARNAKPARRAW
jgi:hypothetical protein